MGDGKYFFKNCARYVKYCKILSSAVKKTAKLWLNITACYARWKKFFTA